METNITILTPFFEDPERNFHIRELSRIVNINHTTVRKYLKEFVNKGLLKTQKKGIYETYAINKNKKFLNLKLFYNLEKIRKSGIVEDLEKYFDYPVIVLFGSYAFAQDNKKSDVDICIISSFEKEFETKKYEKTLNKKVSLHIFSEKTWKRLINKNPELANNISNGIVLSGEFEVMG
ncbi:nucleotidyltransferase domain-containing protein [Candidatus Woesearchaeota archaeon]|nr:nucleotidyltransferase domain-containing protein [Candidatus Woesearchaeota archaeon]